MTSKIFFSLIFRHLRFSLKCRKNLDNADFVLICAEKCRLFTIVNDKCPDGWSAVVAVAAGWRLGGGGGSDSRRKVMPCAGYAAGKLCRRKDVGRVQVRLVG